MRVWWSSDDGLVSSTYAVVRGFMRITYPFAAVPNQIIRGGHGAINLAVLTCILSHGRTTASIMTMAKEIGCDKKSILPSIHYWIEKGESFGVKIWMKKRRGSTTIIEVEVNCMEEPHPKTTSPENGSTPHPKTGHLPHPKTGHEEEPIKKTKDLAKAKELKAPTSEVMNTDIDRTFPRKRLYGNEQINFFLDYWEFKFPNGFTEQEKWARIYLLHLKNKIGFGKLREVVDWMANPDCWWFSRITGYKMLFYKRDIILKAMGQDTVEKKEPERESFSIEKLLAQEDARGRENQHEF